VKDSNKNDDQASENIFHIVDGIVQNVDRTKRLVVIMLIAIVVSIPLSFHITNILTGPPYLFSPARIIIPSLVVLAFIVIGVRQWLVLSKWTKKYKAYKELQEKIDEKFDFESENNKSGEPGANK
jgi:hypothetical protein